MPGLGDAVDERRGAEERWCSESPEGGAAGGAGLPPCRPKEEVTGGTDRRTENAEKARQRGPAMRVRTAAEESLSSERGRPAAPRLATMTEAGREDSELSWGRRHGKVALSSEEDARALRRQALPNVWHQRRAQRVRCMPGLGNGEYAEMKRGTENDGAG